MAVTAFHSHREAAREITGHDDVQWTETAAALLGNYLEQRRA